MHNDSGLPLFVSWLVPWLFFTQTGTWGRNVPLPQLTHRKEASLKTTEKLKSPPSLPLAPQACHLEAVRGVIPTSAGHRHLGAGGAQCPGAAQYNSGLPGLWLHFLFSRFLFNLAVRVWWSPVTSMRALALSRRYSASPLTCLLVHVTGRSSKFHPIAWSLLFWRRSSWPELNNASSHLSLGERRTGGTNLFACVLPKIHFLFHSTVSSTLNAPSCQHLPLLKFFSPSKPSPTCMSLVKWSSFTPVTEPTFLVALAGACVVCTNQLACVTLPCAGVVTCGPALNHKPPGTSVYTCF